MYLNADLMHVDELRSIDGYFRYYEFNRFFQIYHLLKENKTYFTSVSLTAVPVTHVLLKQLTELTEVNIVCILILISKSVVIIKEWQIRRV